MKRSWQTTTCGVLSTVVAISNALIALLDGDTMTNPNWTLVIASVTAGAGLLFARDNNKSSESVGAR